jgi:hypothetical protein
MRFEGPRLRLDRAGSHRTFHGAGPIAFALVATDEAVCATCGRNLAEADDLNRRGRKVYCSRYCLLQAEVGERQPAGSAKPQRRRAVRRAGRWAVGFVLVLIIAFVAVLFVSSSGSTPVAVRAPVTIGDWTLKLQSVNVNARAAPSHAREVIARLSFTYHGPGEAQQPFLFYVQGGHGVRYPLGDCQTESLTGGLHESDVLLFSGASASRNACFLVATNDLSTLTLYAQRVTAQGKKGQPLAFSLHPQ